MTKHILMAVLAITVVGGAAFANGTQEAPPASAAEGTTVGPGFGYGSRGARGFDMGMGMGTMLADNLVEDEGVLVTGVIDDSAAHAAGLERGDVILEMDGQEVSTVAEIHQVIATKRAGQDVELRVRSGDAIDSVTVTLDDRYNMPALGVRGQSEPGARAATMPFGAFPVRILDVVEGSPAAAAGIEAGYLITGIDGEIAAGETITVHYADVDLGASFQVAAQEIETTELTVGEENGAPYIGVRYQPLGGRGGFGAQGGGSRGGRGMTGGFGARGGGPRGGGPRGR